MGPVTGWVGDRVHCVRGSGDEHGEGREKEEKEGAGSQGWEQGSLSHAGSLGSWIRCRRARICLCLVDKLLSKCQHPPGTQQEEIQSFIPK